MWWSFVRPTDSCERTYNRVYGTAVYARTYFEVCTLEVVVPFSVPGRGGLDLQHGYETYSHVANVLMASVFFLYLVPGIAYFHAQYVVSSTYTICRRVVSFVLWRNVFFFVSRQTRGTLIKRSEILESTLELWAHTDTYRYQTTASPITTLKESSVTSGLARRETIEIIIIAMITASTTCTLAASSSSSSSNLTLLGWVRGCYIFCTEQIHSKELYSTLAP